MSDIFDGVGTATEGGLFARALEPDSGAKKPHPDQPDECLNCGAPLTGAYCSACGQSGHLHRTIGAFMHDLLHGALHFEGKFWHTLPMLVFKPGQLTRRYIEGQRARFVSPMALFLFGVFLMFAVFQLVGISAPTDLPNGEQFEESVEQASEIAQSEIARIENRLASEELSSAERTELRTRLEELQQFLEAAPVGEESAIAAMTRGFNEGLAERRAEAGDEDATAAEDGAQPREDFVTTLDDSGDSRMTVNATGIDWIDEIIVDKWRENPGLMLYKMQANAYKFSWLLIPISIPFVWLLFLWKRRFKAYDHAIFVTYSLSFMTFLFITASLLGKAGVEPVLIVLPLLFIPPIHLYKQLRHAYSLGRFSAFWRLMVLSFFIWVVIILFVQLLLMLGAF